MRKLHYFASTLLTFGNADISAREMPYLTGNLVSLLSGGVIAVLVSLLSGKNKEGAEVWEKTRDIDSPLSPWTELYAK